MQGWAEQTARLSFWGGVYVTLPLAPTEQTVPTGSDPFVSDMERVELLLERLLAAKSFPSRLGTELLKAGGKRLRPRLCLLAYRSAASEEMVPVRLCQAAAALELLHLATLVHDDVLDGSLLRRSRPSLNAVHGDGPAVLVGDFFFSRFLQAAAPLGGRILSLLAETIATVVEGELRQEHQRHNPALSEDEYFTIISQKTAALMAASCAVGALIAHAPQRTYKALWQFGYHLGCAFQLQDDILDYVGRPPLLGKPRGGDLAQGVITLPLIHALRDSSRRAQLREWLGQQNLDPRTLEDIRLEVIQCGGVFYAEARVKAELEQATAALSSLPPTAGRQGLEQLTLNLSRRQR